MPADLTALLHRLVGGDPHAADEVIDLAAASSSASLLAAAAVVSGDSTHLDRATRLATSARERQLVVIAEAHLRGDTDLLDVLVRDHLVEHPDHLLAAWIAGRPVPAPRARETAMNRHVVFGTGQVGHPVVEQLLAGGQDVVAVNRGGRGSFPGARVVGGDATDPAFTTSVCAGADVVYFCLNAGSYERWTEEFPPLQRGVLAGAAAAGARLVVLDNLYAYGPPRGRRLVETMAAHPTSAKAATRAAMTAELLTAHADGQVQVAIGRASDYFGPGATRSALGETVFGTALAGRTAQVMGDPDQPHSYSYTPDVARGLITLGTATGATGRVWHLPVAEARTTRELIEAVYAMAGHRPRVMAAGRTTLRAIGLVKPELREYLHTLYQFSEPWVVDDSAFRTAFGDLATPLDEALASTLAWYRDRAAVPVH